VQTSTAARPSAETLTRIRMSGEQRRQHFIDAALRLFSTSGFRGTSTRAIAGAAGVSEALLFRHFPSKADLYAAILQQKAHESGFATKFETIRRLARRGDDQKLVHYIVSLILATYERDPEFERLMLYAALEGHELATASQQLFGMPTFALLRDYVIERQKAGAFRQGEPMLLVFGLISLPVYFSMVHRLLGTKQPDLSNQAVADLFSRIVLDGVRAHADDTSGRGSRRVRRLAAARRSTHSSLHRRRSK